MKTFEYILMYKDLMNKLTIENAIVYSVLNALFNWNIFWSRCDRSSGDRNTQNETDNTGKMIHFVNRIVYASKIIYDISISDFKLWNELAMSSPIRITHFCLHEWVKHIFGDVSVWAWQYTPNKICVHNFPHFDRMISRFTHTHTELQNSLSY